MSNYAVNFAQLTVTMDIAYRKGGPDGTEQVLNWVDGRLNSQPGYASVTLSNATSVLGWPDFLDAPGFGPEHPDYPEAAAALTKVEHWLTLDRKQLIAALQRADDEKAQVALELEEAKKEVAKAQAKAADFKVAHDLFEETFARINTALAKGDLSEALFPRVGEEARIELTTRQSQMLWVLEMLPNPNRP